MIKRFKDFITESISGKDGYINIIKLIEFLQWNGSYGNSYSLMIHKKDKIWEDTKLEVLDELKERYNCDFNDVVDLITNESLWNFFLPRVNSIDSTTDRFIYDMWEELVKKSPEIKWKQPVLGGEGYGNNWVDPEFKYQNDIDSTEFQYKYEYGAHLTEYGQKLIESQNIRLKDFVRMYFDALFDWKDFNNRLKKKLKTTIDIDNWNNDYLMLEEDRIIFDYENFINDNESSINPEELKEEVLKILVLDKYDDNGSQMRIWFEPKIIYHQTKNPIIY